MQDMIEKNIKQSLREAKDLNKILLFGERENILYLESHRVTWI